MHALPGTVRQYKRCKLPTAQLAAHAGLPWVWVWSATAYVTASNAMQRFVWGITLSVIGKQLVL